MTQGAGQRRGRFASAETMASASVSLLLASATVAVTILAAGAGAIGAMKVARVDRATSAPLTAEAGAVDKAHAGRKKTGGEGRGDGRGDTASLASAPTATTAPLSADERAELRKLVSEYVRIQTELDARRPAQRKIFEELAHEYQKQTGFYDPMRAGRISKHAQELHRMSDEEAPLNARLGQLREQILQKRPRARLYFIERLTELRQTLDATPETSKDKRAELNRDIAALTEAQRRLRLALPAAIIAGAAAPANPAPGATVAPVAAAADGPAPTFKPRDIENLRRRLDRLDASLDQIVTHGDPVESEIEFLLNLIDMLALDECLGPPPPPNTP